MTETGRMPPLNSACRQGVMTADGDPGRRQRPSRERSLLDMMSLSYWRRFVLETIGLLAVIWLLRETMFAGTAPGGTMPHPFWIAVLLMSSQYGVMGGLFATLAATGLLFAAGLPPQTATQDFYAYAGAVAGQPCAWFGTALGLGGLRTLHIHHQSSLEKQLEETRVTAGDVADCLERALAEIDHLERRIALDSATLASFTQSLAKLEAGDTTALAAGMADVVRHGAGAISFTLYFNGVHGLEPVAGMENGMPVAAAALPPLAPGVLDELCGAPPSAAKAAPHAAICATEGDGPIGAVVCTKLQPGQDPNVAARRLADLCRLLGVLLAACRGTVAVERQPAPPPRPLQPAGRVPLRTSRLRLRSPR